MLSHTRTFLNKRLRIRNFTLNEEEKQIIKDELNGLSYLESKMYNPSIKNDLNGNKEIKKRRKK